VWHGLAVGADTGRHAATTIKGCPSALADGAVALRWHPAHRRRYSGVAIAAPQLRSSSCLVWARPLQVILSAIGDLAAAADAAAAELDGEDASYYASEADGAPAAASGTSAAPITFESALAATDGAQAPAPAGDPFVHAATAGASGAAVAPHAPKRHLAGAATAVAATTALRRGAAGQRNGGGAGGGSHAAVAASALVRGMAAAAAAPEGPEALDVFISYRRKGGSVLAQLIKVSLKARGINVFLDVENLGSGTFDTALAENLSRARNVVLVLSEGCLDRCIDPATNTVSAPRRTVALRST